MQTETFIPEACFASCAPDGPSTPFGTPYLIWADSFRIVVMLLGLALIVWTPRLVLDACAAGQRARLAGQGIFALIVIGTEVDHMGDYAHYRLFVTFLGIAAMLWGVSRISREIPPRTQVSHRKSA